MLVVLLGDGFIRFHRFPKLTYFDSDERTLVRTFLSLISDHTHLSEFQVEDRPRSLNPAHQLRARAFDERASVVDGDFESPVDERQHLAAFGFWGRLDWCDIEPVVEISGCSDDGSRSKAIGEKIMRGKRFRGVASRAEAKRNAGQD